jgi:hypothetical protein
MQERSPRRIGRPHHCGGGPQIGPSDRARNSAAAVPMTLRALTRQYARQRQTISWGMVSGRWRCSSPERRGNRTPRPAIGPAVRGQVLAILRNFSHFTTVLYERLFGMRNGENAGVLLWLARISRRLRWARNWQTMPGQAGRSNRRKRPQPRSIRRGASGGIGL